MPYFKILNADGFVTSVYKVDGQIVDSHIVSMTEFCSKINYVDELRFDGHLKVKPPSILLRLVNPILILMILCLIGYFS